MEAMEETANGMMVEFPSLAFILPESFNTLVLTFGLLGMYNGVQIVHPLYAVLFANLLVPLVSSAINISSFNFISVEKYEIQTFIGDFFLL